MPNIMPCNGTKDSMIMLSGPKSPKYWIWAPDNKFPAKSITLTISIHNTQFKEIWYDYLLEKEDKVSLA